MLYPAQAPGGVAGARNSCSQDTQCLNGHLSDEKCILPVCNDYKSSEKLMD